MCVGASFISINPGYPEKRISEIIDSCRPSIVIDDAVIGDLDSYGPARYVETDISDADEGYIMYTSGSTGKPKGVIHDRSQFYCDVQDAIQHCKGDDWSFILIADFMFIASIIEMSAYTYFGGLVVIPDDSQRRDIMQLRRLIDENGVSKSSMPPQMVKYFVGTALTDIFAQGQSSGAISAAGINVINLYGCTEMCPFMVGLGVGESYLSLKPLRGSTVRLLDEGGHDADKGEIVVSGPTMMNGYVGDPELTSKVIKVDSDGRRWLHTRDLGMRTSEGIVVMGRLDSMVKVRGQRVEPAEAEYAAMQTGAVVECACVPYGDIEKRLCLFYVGGIEEDRLREELSKALPGYMVPDMIVKKESLPHNANGKIARTLLALPEDVDEGVAQPSNELEMVICDAFSEALGGKAVGPDSSFTRLGGDSLTGMAVISICASKGIRVTPSQLMAGMTPREIARVCERISGDRRYTLETGCPVTGGALDVYLDIVSGKTDSVYILGGDLPLPEGVDVSDAEKAITALADAHPILKARVEDYDGAPRFIFDSKPEIYRGDMPDADVPFDIHACMCRFGIFKGAVSFHIHHMISDGTSMMVLKKDLGTLLGGGTLKTDLSFLEDAEEYSSEREEADFGFYKAMMSEVPDDAVLTPCPSGSRGNGSVLLSPTRDAMGRFASETGVAPACVLTAAFGYMLSRFSGSEYAVFSDAVNGRGDARSLDSVGMYVRHLPLALDCRNRPVTEYLQHVNAVISGAMGHQRCPFWRLSKELGLVYDVTFNILSGISGDRTAFQLDNRGSLSFEISMTEKGYVLEYSHTSKFSDSVVKNMAKSFDAILGGLLSCQSLSDIVYTSEADVREMDALNDTSAPLRFNDIAEAFRRQVAVSPESIFLTYLDHRYTYAEAYRTSDSIASALSSHGVCLGDRVAVMVPRSEWYMLCALGVLKTGAAYVPIDTSYPDERVSFMLSDSSVKAILVTEETSGRAAALVHALKPSPQVISCTGLPVSRFDPVAVSPKDASVILYTSGTTGTPKGSAIPHLALENYVEFYARAARLCCEDVVALYHSFGFDVHIESMLSPIIAGASVCVIPEDVRLDIDLLYRYAEGHGITNLHLPTALGTMFVDRHPV
ncbi:MAG: AMP-binding protein, partial [Candidatus Methanomethylophilaceae archaeon]|nr:AMP-binding protein [Candidatus Methanomethylophilaceae archaeon]